MTALVTALLWLVFAGLITTFLAGIALAVLVAFDILRTRRSSWSRWDREMRQYQAARQITSQEVK